MTDEHEPEFAIPSDTVPEPPPLDSTDLDSTDLDSTERRSPAVIAAAIALPVALVIGVITAAVIASRSPALQPVTISAVPAPAATGAECTGLLDRLPSSLGEYQAAQITNPAPDGARAWQQSEGDPIVLRCGIERPDQFNVASPLQVVDNVQWLQISGADSGVDASTYYAVDRPVYVAVTIPNGSGPTPLQTVSDAVSAALPQKALDPAPLN